MNSAQTAQLAEPVLMAIVVLSFLGGAFVGIVWARTKAGK